MHFDSCNVAVFGTLEASIFCSLADLCAPVLSPVLL